FVVDVFLEHYNGHRPSSSGPQSTSPDTPTVGAGDGVGRGSCPASRPSRWCGSRARLEPREQQDPEHLRAALEHRVGEWREFLRTNPSQGWRGLPHVIGAIVLWVGDAAHLEMAGAADPRGVRVTEGLAAAAGAGRRKRN